MSQARALDQFYTSRTVAASCFRFLEKAVRLKKTDVFIEPSAGDGAFLELMPVRRRVGIDLEPKHPEIAQGDFLKGFAPKEGVSRWVTCGNAPFGKNASLAVQFFNKSAEFCDIVAYVVPLTFRKSSLRKRLNHYFELVAELALPLQAFVFQGEPYSVPCCFQVWVKKKKPRAVINEPLSHSDFEFCSPAEADFAIRRVGGLAGKIIRQFAGYSVNSHYFIRANIDVESLLLRMEAIDWSDVKWNTAGNPSISKREMVSKYAAFLTGTTAKLRGAPAVESLMDKQPPQ